MPESKVCKEIRAKNEFTLLDSSSYKDSACRFVVVEEEGGLAGGVFHDVMAVHLIINFLKTQH